VKKVVIAYVKAALRRTWGRSRQRQQALYNAKISYGQYRCAECENIFRRKDIDVDHIDAVGRFKDFDTYIERLFCDSNKLAILCKTCHKLKTKSDIKKL
jgi:hypothetical protein